MVVHIEGLGVGAEDPLRREARIREDDATRAGTLGGDENVNVLAGNLEAGLLSRLDRDKTGGNKLISPSVLELLLVRKQTRVHSVIGNDGNTNFVVALTAKRLRHTDVDAAINGRRLVDRTVVQELAIFSGRLVD